MTKVEGVGKVRGVRAPPHHGSTLESSAIDGAPSFPSAIRSIPTLGYVLLPISDPRGYRVPGFQTIGFATELESVSSQWMTLTMSWHSYCALAGETMKSYVCIRALELHNHALSVNVTWQYTVTNPFPIPASGYYHRAGEAHQTGRIHFSLTAPSMTLHL
jgi:hypothetical protein